MNENLKTVGGESFRRLLGLGALAAAISLMAADTPPKDPTAAADKAALVALQNIVGQWKGVGLPQRGSARGSWTETAAWEWQFSDGHAGLVMRSTDAKYFWHVQLRPAEKPGQLELIATLPDKKTELKFTGSFAADGKLVVQADQPIEGQPAQITLQLVAGGDRLVMLYEQRRDDRYARLAEVGFTREGAAFAKSAGGPECIVTGGAGTIPVTYKGQTYYVCCTGCKALFNENPEAVLEEYRQRIAEKKK